MQFNLLSAVTWYLWRFDTALTSMRTIAIWLTILLTLSFTATLCLTKKEKRKRLLKIGATFFISYACLLGVTFLTLSFLETLSDGAFSLLLFLPLAILVICVFLTALTLIYSKNKKLKYCAAIVTAVSFIAVLVAMAVRFSNGDSAELNGLTKKDVNSVWLYVAAIGVSIILFAVSIIFDKGYKGYDTKSITYAGALIAMSYALSYLKIIRMPQGGSITVASLLPLMLYSYIFGTKKGVFVGLIYGLLQSLQDPYVIHPAQFLLDYPLAFSAVGLSGIFAKTEKLKKLPQVRFALGALIGGLSRFLMHFLAGSFAFAAFSGTQNPFLYSFIYQAGYVLPDMGVTIVVGIILFSAKSFSNFIDTRAPINNPD